MSLVVHLGWVALGGAGGVDVGGDTGVRGLDPNRQQTSVQKDCLRYTTFSFRTHNQDASQHTINAIKHKEDNRECGSAQSGSGTSSHG